MKLIEKNESIGSREITVILNYYGANDNPAKMAHLETSKAILKSLLWNVPNMDTGVNNEAHMLIGKKIIEWTRNPTNKMGMITWQINSYCVIWRN